ncbi:unnamed protein product [Lota lota]
MFFRRQEPQVVFMSAAWSSSVSQEHRGIPCERLSDTRPGRQPQALPLKSSSPRSRPTRSEMGNKHPTRREGSKLETNVASNTSVVYNLLATPVLQTTSMSCVSHEIASHLLSDSPKATQNRSVRFRPVS